MSAVNAICAPRYLPRERWAEADAKAREINAKNRPPTPLVGGGGEGDKLALVTSKWWGPEVRLSVGFMDAAAAELRARILSHMNAWGRTANVQFVESSTDPVVRIARRSNTEAPGMGGFWSYVGTDVTLIPSNEPTMNLEGFTMNTPDSEFYRVVRHETGHTLGFPHEHMRKELIERLDPERVIAAYMASQGWSRQEVINQLLTPLQDTSILGTTDTDQTSIMCYQVDGSLTKDGRAILGGTDINKLDAAFAAGVYPPTPAA